jgi:exosome complex RNA-binding protein Rrp42 (RNase PH superfamily)
MEEVNSRVVCEGLQHGIRPDLRDMLAPRAASASFGREPGTVLAGLGQTRVFGRVTAELAPPPRSRPNEGSLKLQVDLGLREDPVLALRLQDFVSKTLARALDCSSLGVVSGRVAWAVRCELVLVSDDGGLFDCFFQAAYLALKDFRRPCTTVVQGQVQILAGQSRPLSLTQVLVPFSWGLLPGVIVRDPCLPETRVLESTLRIVMNNYREVVLLEKEGGMTLERGVLERVLELCEKALPERVEAVRRLSAERVPI